MKKSFMTLAVMGLLNMGLPSLCNASVYDVNKEMVKLVFKAQNLNDEQAELAFNAVMSVKGISEDIKSNKENAQRYLTALISSDEMDVEAMMKAYRKWQKNMDVKLEKTLISVAALHGKLDEEQRIVLFQKLQNLSK